MMYISLKKFFDLDIIDKKINEINNSLESVDVATLATIRLMIRWLKEQPRFDINDINNQYTKRYIELCNIEIRFYLKSS